MNIKKLRAKMVERDIRVKELAEITKMNKSTFYRKLKGNGEEFSIKEADSIARALNLNFEEVMSIFFN